MSSSNLHFVCVGVAGSLGKRLRIVRERDWFVLLDVVSRVADLWVGLVCLFRWR